MSKPLQIILLVIVIILVAGGSFYGGLLFGQQQTSTSAAAEANLPPGANDQFQPGQRPFAGARGQGGDGSFTPPPGMVFGQIEQIDGDVLTVATADGNRVQVQVTDTTLVEKNASVAIDQLDIGETVIVNGSENDDGSITARSVQAGSSGRLGGRFGGAQTSQ